MFEVGQKVVIRGRHGYGMVGTVLKITEKRRDVVVQFPTCKVSYNEMGFKRNADVWSMSYIVPLTEDIEEEIERNNKAEKCRNLLEVVTRNVYGLTDRQLDDIISVLSEVEI